MNREKRTFTYLTDYNSGKHGIATIRFVMMCLGKLLCFIRIFLVFVFQTSKDVKEPNNLVQGNKVGTKHFLNCKPLNFRYNKYQIEC